MSFFSWYDAFRLDSRPDGKPRYRHDILRKHIEKHGIYRVDRFYHTVLTCAYKLAVTDKSAIDVIFEYKPDLLTLCGGVITNINFMSLCNYYVLHKFLEQDIHYRYIRCPIRFVFNSALPQRTHSNFTSFLMVWEKPFHFIRDYEYIKIFKNHFWNGITFFELMKYRLIK